MPHAEQHVPPRRFADPHPRFGAPRRTLAGSCRGRSATPSVRLSLSRRPLPPPAWTAHAHACYHKPRAGGLENMMIMPNMICCGAYKKAHTPVVAPTKSAYACWGPRPGRTYQFPGQALPFGYTFNLRGTGRSRIFVPSRTQCPSSQVPRSPSLQTKKKNGSALVPSLAPPSVRTCR